MSFLLNLLPIIATRFFIPTALQTTIEKETLAVLNLEQLEESLSQHAKQLDLELKAQWQLYEE